MDRASFNVIIGPASKLVRLNVGEASKFDGLKHYKRQYGASNKINKVVVSQIHRGPPDPKHVGIKGKRIRREQVNEK